MIVDGYLIYNKLRAGMSPTFQERIPAATKDSLNSIGYRLTPQQVAESPFNELHGELFNRIVTVMFEQVSYENPLEDLIIRDMPWGDIIQHIAVQIGVGRDFRVTPEAEWSNDYIVHNRPVIAEYHKINWRMQWWVTTFWDVAAKAFDSNAGFSSLIMLIVSTLQKERNIDVYVSLKQIFDDVIEYILSADGKPTMRTRPFEAVVNEETAKQVLLAIKNIATAWTRFTGAFNAQGLEKAINSGTTLDLFIRAEFANYLTTEVWSSIFHPEYLGLGDTGVGNVPQIRVRYIEDFGGIYAVDGDGARIYPVYGTTEATRGMVVGWTNTEGGALVPDLAPTSYVDPHENVLALLAERNAIFAARVREDLNRVRSVSGRYDNDWLYGEYLMAWSGFANMCLIQCEAPPAIETWFDEGAAAPESLSTRAIAGVPVSKEVEKVKA